MLGEHLLHHVGRLGGVVHGERAVARVEFGEDRAGLERHPRVAARVERRLDDLVRRLEGFGDVAGLVDAFENEVVAEIGVNDGRRFVERGLHVRDGGQRLPVDVDARHAILGKRAAVGHDGGNGFSGPRGIGQRQRELRRGLHALQVREHGDPGIAMRCQIRPGKHANDTGNLQRRTCIDLADAGVRVRAAQKRDVQHARQQQIVDEEAAPFDEFAHIGARHRTADVGVRPVDGARIDDLAHAAPALALATVSTASTMA